MSWACSCSQCGTEWNDAAIFAQCLVCSKAPSLAAADTRINQPTDKHYDFTYKGVKLDPYRIFKVYGITEPAQQHAIKKLLRAGKKAGNPVIREIDEAILSLQRWREMVIEDQEASNQY